MTDDDIRKLMPEADGWMGASVVDPQSKGPGWSEASVLATVRAVLAAQGDATATLRQRVAELEAAEEGAKEAFGHVVEAKQSAQRECERLRSLLEGAYAMVRAANTQPAAMQEGKRND